MRRALWCSLFLFSGAAGTARGQQLAPAGTGGVAALATALQHLGANKRVLVIGAHPDDENNLLMTWLSLAAGADVAYLSLNRGEGGQNIIGPELGPELGLIRSEELLAARSVDGTRQFFTRVYDFGFSKSMDEAFRFWPRDTVLADVVAIMRRFRPQVVVSIFSGTPSDGHGQHQVAGAVARQAFDLLKDSTWGPVKFYRSTFFDTTATTLRIPTGAIDPLYGKSYSQIAVISRSLHRSQNQGGLQRPGPSMIRLALVATRARSGGPDGLFSGVDTALAGHERYVALIDSARRALNPYHPADVVPYLARALEALTPADSAQRTILEAALANAASVVVDGTADDGLVVPGERLQIEATVWNAGATPVAVEGVDVQAPAGWTVETVGAPGAEVASGTLMTGRFAVTVAAAAPGTQPYFLRHPLMAGGGMYDWAGVPAGLRGEPFEPPPVVVRARLRIAGASVTLTREVTYRYRDEATGEVRRPIFVTRDFDLAVTPGLVVWPTDGQTAAPRTFTAQVTNRTRGAASATVRMTVPAGWGSVAAESLTFRREDESKSVTFTVTPPAGVTPGTFTLRATVTGSDGRISEGALTTIDYPHIRPRALRHPSTVDVRVANLVLPSLARVGYVRGASDRVPEALAAVGVPIVLLDADMLARGDLSRYDAIVIGSRAYETDPALVANNGRLLDYAREGGLVIVQYQQYPFVQGGFAPFRFSIAQPHDRVTDETAPVTELVPGSPVFHVPNAIAEDDWRGWVQERGLYFAHDWDSTYTPLLESHDAGGPPLSGGLLVAPLGRGTYVYTGLSFFRQLPGGVVGAYRLFANLLALKRGVVP